MWFLNGKKSRVPFSESWFIFSSVKQDSLDLNVMGQNFSSTLPADSRFCGSQYVIEIGVKDDTSEHVCLNVSACGEGNFSPSAGVIPVPVGPSAFAGALMCYLTLS